MNVKQDFPIFTYNPKLVYLDSAATSQKPSQVVGSLINFYTQRNANVRRGVYQLADNVSSAYNETARRTVAEFIGAKPHEIVFTSGATAGINIVARGFDPAYKGRDILTTFYEHNSNYLPWLDTGHVVFFDPYTIAWDSFLHEMPGVRLVAITHLSNVTGMVLPVRKVADWAHSFDRPILVDAAQSIGHMPVNVEELGADFLVFSAHKMLGPTGIGVLYINEKWHEQMRSVFSGGGMVNQLEESDYLPANMPDRLEAGTPSIAGVFGLVTAIQYLQKLTLLNIETYIKQLTNRCYYRLMEAGIMPLGGPLKHGIVSFNLPGIHPHDVAFELDKLNIAVRAGHHCAPLIHTTFGIKGSVRASFHIYNTFEDIDRLLDSLAHIQQTFGRTIP
jgi:cysteine desulfurase/selenocysteine lyase